jgi:hypothetical protein
MGECLYIRQIQGITSQMEVRFEFQDICVIAFCGAEAWTLREKSTLKFLKCGVGEGWRRAVGRIVRKINKYYIGFKEIRNILHTIGERKANWIGHIWRRNCFIKHVIDGNVEETGRQGRRSKQLLNGLKEITRYWKLKEDVLDRTIWGTHVEKAVDYFYRRTT